MLNVLEIVPTASLSDVVDAYLRVKTKEHGQAEMGRRIGTQRQGVNMILNRKKGRRFTLEHLERYAQASGILPSQLLKEMALLAWDMEGGLARVTTGALVLPAHEHDEEPELEPAPEIEQLAELLERIRRRHQR